MRIRLDSPLAEGELSHALRRALRGTGTVYAVATDSRECEPGDLFISLAEAPLGASHILEARSRGAVTLGRAGADIPTEDARDSLLSIASYYRSRLSSLRHTVAITGSVGKTTAKDILLGMMPERLVSHATDKNLNNELGVAYTLLSAPSDTNVLITELGMNHRGEISRLSRAVKPTSAMITRIGTAHIGNLGDRRGIAEAKLEITDGMSSPRLIIPYGEPLLEAILPKRRFAIGEYGAEISVIPRSEDSDGMLLDIRSESFMLKGIRLRAHGEHMLAAVGACVGAATEIGLTEEELIAGLSVIRGSSRGEYIRLPDITVYDDTYSSSYEAAINMLTLHRGVSPLSCVLGDMLELGGMSESLHRALGKAAAEIGMRGLYTFGKYSYALKEGAVEGGMRECDIHINENTDAPEVSADAIYRHRVCGETVLIKASHALNAHRITEELRRKYIKSTEA